MCAAVVRGSSGFEGADARDGVGAWWRPLAPHPAGGQHQPDRGARIRGATREWDRVLSQSGSSTSVARSTHTVPPHAVSIEQLLCCRDIKPDNIMLGDGGLPQPMLIDFGLAVILKQPEQLLLLRNCTPAYRYCTPAYRYCTPAYRYCTPAYRYCTPA